MPVRVVFARPCVQPPGDRPIQLWICKLPCFKAFLDEMVTYLFVDSVAGVERWAMHKVAIREAARRSRNANLVD